MIRWKSLVGNMKADMRKTQSDEEAQFDPGFEAEDDELLTHMHDLLLHKIEYHDSAEEEREEEVVYKSTGNLKKWAVLAASLVLVVGLGVTSIGSKPYEMKIVKMVTGGKVSVMMSTVDSKGMSEIDMSSFDSKGMSEIETSSFDSIMDIDQKLGINSAMLESVPSPLLYEGYTVDSYAKEAERIYRSEDGKYLTYSIAVSKVNSFDFNEAEYELIKEYDINIKKHNVSISEYENINMEQRQFVATFSDDYAFYSLNSNVEQKVFDVILDNIYFRR